MSLTNFERWRYYTDALISPDAYINWGFYYLIAAALQRRVWIGPSHMPLYPNIYVILVGEPGLGKGIVIKPVAEILKYHKMPDPTKNNRLENLSVVDRATVEEIIKADYALAIEQENGEKAKEDGKKIYEKPLLFPMAPEATTYEALVRAMAKALRRINYNEYDEQLGRSVMKYYTHSSLCFCLEEISSLFRRNTENIVNFLLSAYDCGDYKYETKTQGIDKIKKCCLNFFGGTTPGFMQATFNDQLLTEGFSSRTFFIYETQNRKTDLWIPDLSPAQKEAYFHLIAHVEKLSHLYGRVEITESTKQFLSEWWKDSQLNRPNINPRLNPYYARKNIHVLKLAMALHFAESFEMQVDQQTFEKAIEILADQERKMHFALGLDISNPLAIPAKKILEFIRTQGKQTRRTLLGEFWECFPKGVQDLDETLEFLQATGKLRTIPVKINGNGESATYYEILRKSVDLE